MLLCFRLNDIAHLARRSPHNANLYYGVTGTESRLVPYGWANPGVVCDSSRSGRVGLIRYTKGKAKDGNAFTGEVRSDF